MLKRNFFLTEDNTKVGKHVYARGRPDMPGIIVDTRQRTGQYQQTYTEVRVFYCRSHRTSKWLPCHYRFCDFDAYHKECDTIYTQGELLLAELKSGEELLRKQHGNQVG